MVNYSQWHTERTTKKVHMIEEINVLSGKMDELMKLFASKSASIDPNDIPLSSLIENNNESMDACTSEVCTTSRGEKGQCTVP